MLRSRQVHTIHELASQGKSIHAIARDLGLARNTVRKYLRGAPPARTRLRRRSKLDPFKAQIQHWIKVDHLYNCQTMLERLRPLGYTGQVSILKQFVQQLRPPKAGRQPVRRYETKPGEQLQFDWGEFRYEDDGTLHKLYGFTAVLSYSRMRFVVFTKRCNAPTLIRCLMAACEYFGGLPRSMLTDRMKSILLQMDGTTPQWHPLFGEFMAAVGVAPRVCKPYTPQTKGKIERSVGVIKHSFWPGVRFTDLDDLNEQARSWCVARNRRVHRTTRARPIERWPEEQLQPLPQAWAWERFATEERKVSWDGFISYDGVQYGLPAPAQLPGMVVQVRERSGELTVWRHGQLVTTIAKRALSREVVMHADQFRNVPSAAAQRRASEPLAHHVPAPHVDRRALADYDQLCGVEVAA